MIDEKEQIAQYFIDMLAVEFEKGRKEGYKAGYKAGVGDAKNPTLLSVEDASIIFNTEKL